MYTVKFNKNKNKNNCQHKLLIVSAEHDLDCHSASPIHHGVCPQCHKRGDFEIRHMNYVVVGCNNKELEFHYFVKFENLFKYDVDYTEREIVEKLIEVYNPLHIINGRRSLYSQIKGINEDALWTY